MPPAVAAVPIDDDPKMVVKDVEAQKGKGATTEVTQSLECQKMFAVADGQSFEDQAGFLGRWLVYYYVDILRNPLQHMT